MRIVIAPDSFKEALDAEEVCAAIARGVRRARPEAEIDTVPIADGGEGTVNALIAATSGRIHRTAATGPLGERVEAAWGMLGDGSDTAVIEMAGASGLAMVPAGQRDPERTTTFGTGELIRAALDAGARRILVGIGGSATTDGGIGAAQAVGVRFLDEQGQSIEAVLTGGMLGRIAQVDLAGRDPRVGLVPIRVACDVDNPVCGPRGAAAVYGPQKGATPAQVKRLDRSLGHLMDVIARDLGRELRDLPGAGAAGGLGAGMMAFFDATLGPGVDLVMKALRLRERLAGADLLITGEGRIDAQSMMGKAIAGVGRTGQEAGVPVVALAGCVGEGAESTRAVLRSYHVINPAGMPLEQALARTAEGLEETTAALLPEWLGG